MNRKRITKYMGIGVSFFFVLLTVSQYREAQRLQEQLAEKVLRFHVLANSDSKEDQGLKLVVRDTVGGYMQEHLGMMVSKQECEAFVSMQLPEIERIAEQVIEEAGYPYDVDAELAKCEFPVKSYGEYTFPAGEYDALRITIGEGAGKNWWCVLYPNMCFMNSMYEVVDENAKEALRAVLDEEEYEAVLSSGDYEIKWSILEWLR